MHVCLDVGEFFNVIILLAVYPSFHSLIYTHTHNLSLFLSDSLPMHSPSLGAGRHADGKYRCPCLFQGSGVCWAWAPYISSPKYVWRRASTSSRTGKQSPQGLSASKPCFMYVCRYEWMYVCMYVCCMYVSIYLFMCVFVIRFAISSPSICLSIYPSIYLSCIRWKSDQWNS